jgi:tetratricopeptide (TPR) repeat protein
VTNRNRYDAYHPGLANGYWNPYGYGMWGSPGYGYPVGAWGAGSPMYGWGYSGYNNPYSAGYPMGAAGAVPGNVQSAAAVPVAAVTPATSAVPVATTAPAYDYSQPLSTTADAPPEADSDDLKVALDQSVEAFKAGDYAKAQQLDNQAIAKVPNDPTPHELLALALFAQGQYVQAAAPLYTVVSAGPGWDWTSLISMYPDADTYTNQLRGLEKFITANPSSAPARFVLAYHYICQGHNDEAAGQLKKVVKLDPSDKLSAQLLTLLQPGSDAKPEAPADRAPANSAASKGQLAGTWSAAPAEDAKVTLAVKPNGKFSWTVAAKGKPDKTLAGTSTVADGVLTLDSKTTQDGALAGNITWRDADHFNFRLVGAPSSDQGLDFAK